MFTTSLALIGLIFGLIGLAVGGYALLQAREAQNEYRTLAKRALDVNVTGADPRTVRDVAVLHYDALEEMSGARSFSLALLNSHGDGVVVTSINGRTETRTYAKVVTRGESEGVLSPEEYRAVRSARLGEGVGATLPEPEPTEDEPVSSEPEKDPVTVVPRPEKEPQEEPEKEPEKEPQEDIDGIEEARAPEPRTSDFEVTEPVTPNSRN